MILQFPELEIKTVRNFFTNKTEENLFVIFWKIVDYTPQSREWNFVSYGTAWNFWRLWLRWWYFCVLTAENATLRVYNAQNDVKNTPDTVFLF